MVKWQSSKKLQTQMWVNETDNGKQWCMVFMISFLGSCQTAEYERADRWIFSTVHSPDDMST